MRTTPTLGIIEQRQMRVQHRSIEPLQVIARGGLNWTPLPNEWPKPGPVDGEEGYPLVKGQRGRPPSPSKFDNPKFREFLSEWLKSDWPDGHKYANPDCIMHWEFDGAAVEETVQKVYYWKAWENGAYLSMIGAHVAISGWYDGWSITTTKWYIYIKVSWEPVGGAKCPAPIRLKLLVGSKSAEPVKFIEAKKFNFLMWSVVNGRVSDEGGGEVIWDPEAAEAIIMKDIKDEVGESADIRPGPGWLPEKP